MARPTEYDGPRVDTKVRLRPDHARLLKQAQEDRGVGRNRLVEIALDQFFGIRSTSPKLKKAPSDPDVSQGSPSKRTRTSPRLRRPGEAMAAASEAAQGSRITP